MNNLNNTTTDIKTSPCFVLEPDEESLEMFQKLFPDGALYLWNKAEKILYAPKNMPDMSNEKYPDWCIDWCTVIVRVFGGFISIEITKRFFNTEDIFDAVYTEISTLHTKKHNG